MVNESQFNPPRHLRGRCMASLQRRAGVRAKLDPDAFRTRMAEELIDNKFDETGLRRRRIDREEGQSPPNSGNGHGPHLKKTKSTRKVREKRRRIRRKTDAWPPKAGLGLFLPTLLARRWIGCKLAFATPPPLRAAQRLDLRRILRMFATRIN